MISINPSLVSGLRVSAQGIGMSVIGKEGRKMKDILLTCSIERLGLNDGEEEIQYLDERSMSQRRDGDYGHHYPKKKRSRQKFL
jgi:hypothetical protein